MNELLGFMNLFIVPFISVRIYTRRQGKRKALDTMMLYATFAPVLVICTRCIGVVISKMLGIQIKTDGFKYTLTATVAVYILPYLAELFKKFIKVECSIGEGGKQGERHE